jgi:hypothetical protein
MAAPAATKNPRTSTSANRKPASTGSFEYLLSGTDGYFRQQSMTAKR